MGDPAPGKAELDRKDWLGLAHLNPADEPVFILTKEHDFGAAATAVATKITDSAPCNGEVLGALFVLTEANRQFAKGDDIYAYTDAQTSRSAGIYHVVLICKKIA